ncbi:hypothetical protein PENVUL_c030G04018 [Penicillium vulpinum]|uniref:Transcription factor domain-containing protein n=1 Tax=Penicillium vulpinum TaxID=29845 RepID=A0A1V6RT16_9EURO|nr:hypothetical protein PENVUL_c030G04018 [Penicillium vulpinum]
MAIKNELNSGDQFFFIPIQNSNDRIAKRLARSHAVAHGLRKKRRLQQSLGHNFHFHVLCPANDQSKSVIKEKHGEALIAPQASIDARSSDPFQMLAAESPILQALLNRQRSQQAMELVFSISDELVLQNFCSVLRKGLGDNALLSAVMLTFSFTATADMSSMECLEYQNETLRSVRQRMSSPDKAATEPTIGAILLLAGIEIRLGMTRQVQFHMKAIQHILDLCQRKGIYLSADIKRAVFWSDLNGSVMTGSSRVVDHTTFSELQWRRDPSNPDFFILPPGFQSRSYLLDQNFVEILRDVFALQCIRDSPILGTEGPMSMAHIDNHQASIQSRLNVAAKRHIYARLCCAANYGGLQPSPPNFHYNYYASYKQ